MFSRNNFKIKTCTPTRLAFKDFHIPWLTNVQNKLSSYGNLEMFEILRIKMLIKSSKFEGFSI